MTKRKADAERDREHEPVYTWVDDTGSVPTYCHHCGKKLTVGRVRWWVRIDKTGNYIAIEDPMSTELTSMYAFGPECAKNVPTNARVQEAPQEQGEP